MASAQPDLTPQAQEAARLAGLGFRVFPCHSISPRSNRCTCGKARCDRPGKHPRTENGLNDATSDLAQVASWWRTWPDANPALATGLYGAGESAMLLLVLDIDSHKGGDESLAMLEAKIGRLPESAEALTGGGGRHIYFKANASLDVRNSVSLLGEGLDIRGVGGYVMLPTSRHQSGSGYSWEIDHALGQHPVAEVPATLLEALKERKRSAGKRAAAGEAGVTIIEGGRNAHLTSLAGTMRRRGTSEKVILASLLAENADRCVPPLDEAEVATIARSIARYAPADTGQAHPAPAPAPTAAPGCSASDWESRLRKRWVKQRGELVEVVSSDLFNVGLVLRYAPEWEGVFRLNEARGEIELHRAPPYEKRAWAPRALTDADEVKVRMFLIETRGLQVSRDMIHDVLVAVAEECKCNPLADWLNGLVWDGKPRLDTWLVRLVGATDTPYVRAAGATWLRGAIARALEPGCKFDLTLVLEGKTGRGKSSLFSILGGEYFCDNAIDLHSKDTAMQIRRSWINEIPEMAAGRRSDDESKKAFLTRTSDQIRLPYGRNVTVEKRRCVFGGSTNSDDYFTDPTGNRRYLPVRVRIIDLEGVAAEREQLLAEAVVTWRAGAGLALPPGIWGAAAEEQEQRTQTDSWEEAIRLYLDGRAATGVGMAEVLNDAVRVPIERQGRHEQMRAAQILQRCGWAKRQVRLPNNVRVGRYFPRDPDPDLPVSPTEPVAPTYSDGSMTQGESQKDGLVTNVSNVSNAADIRPEVAPSAPSGSLSAFSSIPTTDVTDVGDKRENIGVPASPTPVTDPPPVDDGYDEALAAWLAAGAPEDDL